MIYVILFSLKLPWRNSDHCSKINIIGDVMPPPFTFKKKNNPWKAFYHLSFDANLKILCKVVVKWLKIKHSLNLYRTWTQTLNASSPCTFSIYTIMGSFWNYISFKYFFNMVLEFAIYSPLCWAVVASFYRYLRPMTATKREQPQKVS